MPATELSGPLPPEQFTQTLYSRHHGTEYGIRGDTDGSAFGITLPPASDEATFGSATVDSICKVGGYPLIIPKTTPHSLEIPPALTGGTTGRTDLVVARFAPATYTTAPGPVRLHRIAGTPGSLTVPAHIAGTDLPMWAVRRRQGEALNQAIVTDLRSWTGIPTLVKSGAPLPLTAPLGARATRDGITYRRDFVGAAVDWVQENWPVEVLTGLAATESAASGWQRQSTCRLEREGKRRWLHLVVTRGPGETTITSSDRGAFSSPVGLATLHGQDRPPSGTLVGAIGRALPVTGGVTYTASGLASSTGSVAMIGTAPDIDFAWSASLAQGAEIVLDAHWWVA